MEKYDKVTDEQLIKDFRNGDREIMDHLMMKYKAMVRKKARAMYLFGGENEDLIQEGMIGIMTRIRELLLRVLRNFVCQDRCIPQSRHQKEKSTYR